jgi:NAD(P)-dependent dehydrogenase (short-subunit alcohol dehydrogenase family)
MLTPLFADIKVLITGPSASGIGGATAIALAGGEPGHLILTSRKLSTIQPVIETISEKYPRTKVSFVECDLASQNSIREAATQIQNLVTHLDIIINNAAVPPCPFSETKDGIELQFGVDHIGHFLLTNLLISKFLAAPPGARIINVSSSAMRFSVPMNEYRLADKDNYTELNGYAQAKGANVIFTKSLAKRLALHMMQSFSIHPGGIDTGMKAAVSKEALAQSLKAREEAATKEGTKVSRPKRKTLEQGCATTLVAALDPSIATRSGEFLEDCNISQRILPRHLVDEEEAENLWKLSEKIVGEAFSWS